MQTRRIIATALKPGHKIVIRREPQFAFESLDYEVREIVRVDRARPYRWAKGSFKEVHCKGLQHPLRIYTKDKVEIAI